jgi:putative ABC transport system ATP-binding protein
VESGGLNLVLGPSGSGKSTLLRLLNRLEDADEGEVLLGGEGIRALPVLEVRRRVGMVQQRPALFEGTVLDNLCYGPRLRRVSDSECQAKAARCLGLVGLGDDLLPRPASQLSGGQQHRVALARALANDPEALLLDEPTSSLDPTAVAGILRLVASLNRDLGLTVVLVTHSLSLAKELGGRMALLVEGRLVEEGETEEVFRKPKTEALRLFLEGRLEERPSTSPSAMKGD